MYRILFFFIKLISYIPFWLLYVISDILFFPLYYIARYRRKIVRRNLTESFPDKSLAEIKRIEKKFYHFLADTALETCKLYSISKEEIMRRAVYKNVELPNSLLLAGQSLSVYIGHYSNWEWMSSFDLWMDDKATSVQIYHRLNNKYVDKFMLQLREKFGNKCVDMNETVRFIANAAHNHTPIIVGFIADQSPKRRDSKYFIDFLNHKVPVLTGTEKLTKHFGMGALFLSAKRIKRGYYQYTFEELCADPKSLSDFELTDLYFKRLEKEIHQNPEFYLWSHNRFRYAVGR